MRTAAPIVVALVLALACSRGEEAQSAPIAPSAPPHENARPEPHETQHDETPHDDPHAPDETTAASMDPHAESAHDESAHQTPAPAPSGPVDDELGVAALVRRNHERMRAMRDAPVHVISERDPVRAGERICEAVVPRRPPATPVLIKPNLSGIDQLRDRIDDGLELRTTSAAFLRGVIRCLRARGHTEITITDAWSRADQREDWLRATGLGRLIAEEGVRFVGLWEERGPDGASPMIAAPNPGARRLRDELLVPRLVARHLTNGLYIDIPRMKMHRYAVMSLGIKNTMGLVVLRGAEEPGSRSGAMHAEIGPWLTRFRRDHVDDRDAYVRSLEIFAERIVDVLEIELPDAVLIDGTPPVAGDGFRVIEPLDESVAIGSINPVYADAVGMEWMGYLDNAELERELHHRTSPLLEEAARRFYERTDVLRDIAIVGDDSFRRTPRVAHYVAFPGFEIGRASDAVELPWIARAMTAPRASAAPAIDGVLDDAAWRAAPPIAIERDYADRRAGPETIARLTWTPDALFFAFDCAYEGELDLPDAPIEEELTDLYRHDVVELFLDEAPRSRGTYRELEVGPRGHFLDVAVDLARRPRGDTAWSSGMEARTSIDPAAHRFRIEGRIPAAAFERERLGPGEWRANLYRIAGRSPRTFMARYPTYAERPNFHVPERFGWLRLVDR